MSALKSMVSVAILWLSASLPVTGDSPPGPNSQTPLHISLYNQSHLILDWNLSHIQPPPNHALFLSQSPSPNARSWFPVIGPAHANSFPLHSSLTLPAELDQPFRFFKLSFRPTPPTPPRGSLHQSSLIKVHGKVDVQAAVSRLTGGLVANLPFLLEYGVEAQRIEYWTPWIDGTMVLASGVLFIPVGLEETKGMISYQHGTIYDKRDAPTEDDEGEFAVGLFLGARGYICFMADYLGFGANQSLIHPYLHSETEAGACLDMMRAGRIVLQKEEIHESEKLFLLGYSQGGHATMALHRTMEETTGDEFNLAGSAPMAGPHSMSDAMLNRMLEDRDYPNPFYLVYLMLSYNQAYGLFDSLDDYLRAPYARSIQAALIENLSDGAINDMLPSVPNRILRPEVFEEIRSREDHPFRLALKANDTFGSGWKPKAPIRMYHCKDDEIVPYRNSELAESALKSNDGSGSEVEVRDPRLIPFLMDGSHIGCVTWALIAVNDWIEDRSSP